MHLFSYHYRGFYLILGKGPGLFLGEKNRAKRQIFGGKITRNAGFWAK